MIRSPVGQAARATLASRVPRLAAREARDVWSQVRALEPGALLIDIEPFVAAWRTDEAALLRGLAEQLDRCSAIQGLREVVFVTNSRRTPGEALPRASFPVSYIAHARKPFLDLSRFASLRSPVVVIGDQVLTDGLMAWRLHATFVQVPLPARRSFGVRAQSLLGGIVASLFFRRLESPSARSGGPGR